MTQRRISRQDQLRQLLGRATSLPAAGIDDIYATDLPPAERLRWPLEKYAAAIMERQDLVSVYPHEYRNLPPEQWIILPHPGHYAGSHRHSQRIKVS